MGSVSENDIVVPGDFLGPFSSFSKGSGTCIRGSKLYAVLAGKVSISNGGGCEQDKPTISIDKPKSSIQFVPAIGTVIICLVMNIGGRQARVKIISVKDQILPQPLHGVIRKEDIRAMEKDTVEVFQSFRPRDLVRARVITHGEGQTYVLSTAENELGVVWAKCECGAVMQPLSWCEMQCSKRGDKEKRKVARVVNPIPVLV